MESIKKSFANCSICPLLDAPSCILETNSNDDLTKVEVVFVAENPGKDEVKQGLPLVGVAGQMFRLFFKKFGLDKFKYLITNIVLCQTLNPDGTTGNPDPEVIELCKVNAMNLIKTCNPKLVVVMGTSPMSAFGIAKSGITNLHGQVFEWEGYKVFLTVHPSFVNRNKNTWTDKFELDMAKIVELLTGKKIALSSHEKIKKMGKGIFRYKIPEHFYTEDYRLVDVQYLSRSNQILYMFRDKDNKKVYHKEDDTYVCYQSIGIEARKIVPFDELTQVAVQYKDKTHLDPDKTYEGDIKLTAKHAMDYYYFNKGEAPRVLSNIMFCDIEIDTGKDRVFPDPKQARYPMCIISTIYNGEKIVYVIDNKTESINKKPGVKYKIHPNEISLIREFIKDFKEKDPDFLSGWNFINFDIDYIYNRLERVGIPQISLSKFGEFYADGKNYICHLSGTVVLDQEFLYKMFTFTKMENYKLGFIAQKNLGVTKIQLPLPFNEMYWKMLNTTIDYNIRDCELLEMLEKKLAHINLLNEIRTICNASFDTGSSSFGQIDIMMVSFLKNKGLASKNSDPHIVKEEYPGAFVFEPIPGIYNNVTDFDFASLYPSLMITYNIGINCFVMKLEDATLGYELTYCPEKLPEKINVIIDPVFKREAATITRDQLLKKISDNKLVFTINGCFFKNHKKDFSVFGEVVENIMGSRKTYKKKMLESIEKKDQESREFFYTRQLVYKVLANTLYGVVANKAFRFFDVSLAGAITLSGQEALKTCIIEGDAFLRSLKDKKEYKPPKPLTKQEMFSDIMPDRNNDYIITGDTDSIFCCFEKFKEEKTVINIKNWCSQVENFLNQNIVVNIVKKHNVDLDFNRLALKNELVISRGLFLAKKRYAIRVINQEGKDTDEINYMGVEIKRSDFPSKSKEFLSELTELILKNEKLSLPKILDFIKSKEREFLDLINKGDKSIARPITYGKDIDSYKVIPQGVRAMEAWNKIMYDVHKPGSKAYMFWVKGIDIDKAPKEISEKYQKFISEGHKISVVACPDEEERLPDYFIKDVQTTLDFSFKDRYELMLKPLFEVKEKSQLILF